MNPSAPNSRPSSDVSWGRSGSTVRLLAWLMLALAAAGCGGATAVGGTADGGTADRGTALGVGGPSAAVGVEADANSTASADERAESAQAEVETAPVPDPSPATEPTPTGHPLIEAATELPRAQIGFEGLAEAAADRAVPVSIEIESINVRDAQVIPVGVNPQDLSLEVPPADQVGWYEFGSAPGEPGSAVLAAHIAYNGVDGVFRYLADVEVGSIVQIGFDDGTTKRFRIDEVVEYIKEELPDSLFDRDGDERLALITCGGSFNYQLDSYESNSVAIAVAL